MKETPIFEEVFNRLLQLPGFWGRLLVGGLLSFVPIVNIFAFGYLYRLSRAVRQSGQPAMPAWPGLQDWQGLFMDGLRFAVVWLVYWLLPILLAAGIAWLMTLVFLGALANVLFFVVVLLATCLFSAALYRFNMRQNFYDLLDVPMIVRMAWLELPRMILPSIVFLGLIVLLFPFYGFAIFGGFLLMITYTSLRYRNIERNKSV